MPVNRNYGTFLAHLVLDTLKVTDKPLAVREIALLIHVYDTRREQRNFNDRVRRAVRNLREDQLIASVDKTTSGNIIITKYKTYEQDCRQGEGAAEKGCAERQPA